MKKIIIAICAMLFAVVSFHLVNGQARVKYCGLAIEYIGNSDIPFWPIVISDTQNGADWLSASILKSSRVDLFLSKHIVSPSIMKALISEAALYRINAPQKQKHPLQSYKALRLTIVTYQNQTKYELGPQNAISMIKALMIICKKETNLKSNLSDLIEEIDSGTPQNSWAPTIWRQNRWCPQTPRAPG
jgi:hypothetical protein